MRNFEIKTAVRHRVPLLLGLVGSSSSGKTYSALRLATGMQRVIGGDIAFIDTEAKRGAHYADLFKFKHVDFQPPFGPLDYLAAIQQCVASGAKILIIDSMTHEHSSEGGVMDQSEKFLDAKCGDDWKCREKNFMLSLIKPKSQRKKLNSAIVQMGVSAVFCYRAQEKIKPVSGSQPIDLGWQPETTSTLYYEMTQRFLLTPGCDGVPDFFPDSQAGKNLVKNPAQFRNWFQKGQQLDESLGERMARWAAGPKAVSQEDRDRHAELSSLYRLCSSPEGFSALEERRKLLWPNIDSDLQIALKAASDEASKRVGAARAASPPAPPPPNPPVAKSDYVAGVDDPFAEGSAPQ